MTGGVKVNAEEGEGGSGMTVLGQGPGLQSAVGNTDVLGEYARRLQRRGCEASTSGEFS